MVGLIAIALGLILIYVSLSDKGDIIARAMKDLFESKGGE